MTAAGTTATQPPPSGAGHSWQTELEALTRSFLDGRQTGVPKHVQLQLVIKHLIERGELSPGRQLPPEQQLAQAVGVSLGTAQKALNRLAAEGWLARVHGHGTFVAESKRPLADLWHYRFIDPNTKQMLPVYSALLERRHLAPSTKGPWVAALGEDRAGYVEIVRLIDVGGRFRCHSRMQLGATRFSSLMDLPVRVFRNVNLKQIFAEQFAAPTLTVSQTAVTAAIPRELEKVLGVGPRAAGLRLEIAAYTHGDMPLSFQQIIVPATEYPIDLTPIWGEPHFRR